MIKNLLLLLIGIFFSLPLFAADADCKIRIKENCVYNPHPEKDDFILPMPGGMEMVFRKVIVPGEEFWGNRKRLVKIGDIAGAAEEGIFEGVQKLPVSGAFYDNKAKYWYYFLGKYEVTLGQYLAVMSLDDDFNYNEKLGIENLKKASNDKNLIKDLLTAKGNKKYKLLSAPVAWIGWYDYQTFMHHYNLWCYQNTACLKALPKLQSKSLDKNPGAEDIPGFVRLPTELEWEYAARGGSIVSAEIYSNPLPFAKSELDDYAYIDEKSVTRVGRKKPTLGGFYDLFGNVQELTANLFSTETIQGKVGALTARGGSYLSNAFSIRTSLRTEIPIYQKDERKGKIIEARSSTTGIRLAIGSVVLPSARFKDVIKDSYDAYVTELRDETAAGRSILDTTLADIDEARESLKTVRDKGKIGGELDKVLASLEEAELKLQQESQETVIFMVRIAFKFLGAAAFSAVKIDKGQAFLDKFKGKSVVSSKIKQIIVDTETQLVLYRSSYESNFQAYLETLEKLNKYKGGRFIKIALREAYNENKRLKTPHYESHLNLLEKHIELTSRGKVPTHDIMRDIQVLGRVYE